MDKYSDSCRESAKRSAARANAQMKGKIFDYGQWLSNWDTLSPDERYILNSYALAHSLSTPALDEIARQKAMFAAVRKRRAEGEK